MSTLCIESHTRDKELERMAHEWLKRLVIKRYPFTEKLFAKYPNLDKFEREELALAIAETFRRLEHKVAIYDIFREDPKFIREQPEVVDDVVSDNILLADLLVSDSSRYLCFCGGGVCSENAPFPCATTFKDIDGTPVCDPDSAYYLIRRLGISDGSPWMKYYCDTCSPHIAYNPDVGGVEMTCTVTPQSSYTVNSIILGGEWYSYTSAKCCDTCPDTYHTPGEAKIIPVFYWPYTKNVVGGSVYQILIVVRWS